MWRLNVLSYWMQISCNGNRKLATLQGDYVAEVKTDVAYCLPSTPKTFQTIYPLFARSSTVQYFSKQFGDTYCVEKFDLLHFLSSID